MVLRSGGYEVKEVHSLAKAQSLAESDMIDLMVICHTVPESDQLKLITAVRRTRRMLPILCISDQEYAFVAPGCERTSSSPMELLEGVHEAVSGRAL